ncbi:MAG: DUF3313 domain-containing protein [Kiritimatiellae bacterium]|nr:DUF3313 domain-containing protein [Kiritimatiellia bacterium]
MKVCTQFKTSAIVFGAMTAALLSGCSSTYQARSTKKSGFLQNYSQLKPGQDDRALLVYVNPQANFKAYNKIMLEPVKVYVTKGSALAKLKKEDLQSLLNYLDSTLREHLKADYAIVNQPGPGVMRLRVAITEAKGSRVILDTISTVIPYSLALSEVKRIATGSHMSVGSARVECEALDSISNARLLAAVDERVGRKITGKFDKFDKWHTAHDAFDYWAERLQVRLREERTQAVAK